MDEHLLLLLLLLLLQLLLLPEKELLLLLHRLLLLLLLLLLLRRLRLLRGWKRRARERPAARVGQRHKRAAPAANRRGQGHVGTRKTRRLLLLERRRMKPELRLLRRLQRCRHEARCPCAGSGGGSGGVEKRSGSRGGRGRG